MPRHIFIFTKAFWLTQNGKPDFLGYFYMSAFVALVCMALTWIAAFFGYAEPFAYATGFFMTVALTSFFIGDF